MTENERYCVRAGYWHNYTGIGRCEDENLTTNKVCDLINEQNKTITKLEKENRELKQKVNFYKYFQKDARELEKENEQLKEESKLFQCTVVEILDFIDDNNGVSLEEMEAWWEKKEKELEDDWSNFN